MDLDILAQRLTKTDVKVVITNAFSINMLESGYYQYGFIHLDKDMAELVSKSRNVKSYVGHADTAAVMSADLGVEIQHNRETLILTPQEVLLVGQYKGPRLEEGAKSLPPGAVLEWWLVHPLI